MPLWPDSWCTYKPVALTDWISMPAVLITVPTVTQNSPFLPQQWSLLLLVQVASPCWRMTRSSWPRTGTWCSIVVVVLMLFLMPVVSALCAHFVTCATSWRKWQSWKVKQKSGKMFFFACGVLPYVSWWTQNKPQTQRFHSTYNASECQYMYCDLLKTVTVAHRIY